MKANPESSESVTSLQRFLRRQKVVEFTGIPESTIYEMVGRGEFPRPVRISPRLVAWVEGEVIAWQAARIAERSAKREAA
jgi:prophage regulatory protein